MSTERINGIEFRIDKIDSSCMGDAKPVGIAQYRVDGDIVGAEEFLDLRAEALKGLPTITYHGGRGTITPWQDSEVVVWCAYCGRSRMSTDRNTCLGCGASKIEKTEQR